MLKVFLMYFISIAIYNIHTKDANNYGSFKIALRNLQICKGPKNKDCSLVSVKIDDNSIFYNMTIIENVSPTKGKIVATSNGKEVMRLQMNKPCDHLFIRPILKTKLNATNQCVILKGQYTFKLDYEELFESYYAGSFVYGNWTFKATVYGNHCNFICSVCDIEFMPKNKQ